MPEKKFQHLTLTQIQQFERDLKDLEQISMRLDEMAEVLKVPAREDNFLSEVRQAAQAVDEALMTLGGFANEITQEMVQANIEGEEAILIPECRQLLNEMGPAKTSEEGVARLVFIRSRYQMPTDQAQEQYNLWVEEQNALFEWAVNRGGFWQENAFTFTRLVALLQEEKGMDEPSAFKLVRRWVMEHWTGR